MDKSGSAIQVVKNSDHTFLLNDEELEKILLEDDIKDYNVVVVSVTGVFRKGKSFLLDFFIRYLKSKYVKKEKDWIGEEDKPLDGFRWRGGAERETTGILMWSEIFKTEISGEKVAVILLDTQGTFDSQSTVKDCATVFALSTMLSSIQIYNLSQNIQEDDLQHLQLFTEYGKLALSQSCATPFQKLEFLIRDWSFPYETPYGEIGGKMLLDKRLEINETQHPELQSIRRHIKSCFSEIGCFLMPHPGLKVATSSSFDGQIRDIEPQFVRHLIYFIDSLLSPEKLIVKKIDGQTVKVKDLLQYFKTYSEMYQKSEIPEPKTILAATAEANNLAASAAAKDTYQNIMEELCGSSKPYTSLNLLREYHTKSKAKSLEQFTTKRKMGGEDFSEGYRLKLEKDIDDMFVRFEIINENKNLFKSARTPAVLFSVAIFFYIVSGVFAFLGFYTLANISNLMTTAAIFSLLTWAYVRYNGTSLEMGILIDNIANGMWDNLMCPICNTFFHKTINDGTKTVISQPQTESTESQN